MYQYFVASPGTLSLATNAPGVKWSWGVNMPSADETAYQSCAVKVRYTVLDQTPDGPDPDTDGYGKYHYFYGRPNSDELYYRRKFLGGRDLWMRVAGLLRDEVHLEVNREYAKYITHRFMNLHSPGYILTDIVGWALIQHGLAPVHCAAFAMNDASVLVLAPPNSGKTLTTMRACMELGADFIAEDVAITDGQTLFSVPWTSTFRYYEAIDRSWRTKALNRLTQVFPPAELLPVAKSSRVDELVGKSRIREMTSITHVVILERHESETLTPVNPELAITMARNLNRYEFNYIKSPTLVAYEYFNPDLRVEKAFSEEGDILGRAVLNANERLVARTRDPMRYADLIVDHLK